MDITHLYIENFLSIEKADLELDRRGLLLIQGVNQDDPSAKSNGAGKSSVVDALCWALYGVTARGASGDAVVNDVAKKSTVVRIMLSDGADNYKIERYRKHPKFKNETHVWKMDPVNPTGGVSTPLHKATEKETQEVLTDIIGSSLEVFQASVYAGQEKMPDLPGMTDKFLKTLVEEAAGTEVLAAAYDIARRKMLVADSETNIIKGRLDSYIDRLDQLKREQASHVVDEANFDSGRKLRAKGKLADVPTWNREIADFNTELAKYDEPALIAEQTELNAKLADHGKLTTELARRRHAVSAIEHGQVVLHGRLESHKRDIDSLNEQIADMDKLIGTPCKECGKPYHEHDLEAAKKARLQKLLDIRAAVGPVLKQYKEGKVKLDEANTDADFYASGIPDVSVVAARLAAVTTQLNSIQTYRSHINRLSSQITNAKTAAKSELDAVNPYTAIVTAAKGEIERVDKLCSETEAALLSAAIKYHLLEEAVKVFGPAGVRAHILDTVTPFLNQRTADYLGVLSDGNIEATWSTLTKTAKGDLKEKFNIEVTNKLGGGSFGLQSGGEKRKVRLATAMALQDMVAARATKPINIFIADEIDAALDDNAMERLFTVLEGKARERGTVMVISHTPLKDWCDQVITVTKSGKKSTVSGDCKRGF
jgi:DNA repair exonuclease SbcCD ATPase subunit